MASEAKRSHLKAEMLHATAICVFSAWEPRVSKKCVKSDEAKQVYMCCTAIYACDISKGVCTSAGKCLGIHRLQRATRTLSLR